MSYPFYETLEYSHQFKSAREEAERIRAKREDIRKERRYARKALKANKEFIIGKPGKWVSRYYQSSGAYKSAYAYARSENEYYNQAYY